MTIDPQALARRVDAVNVLIGSHAGSVEVLRASAAGLVTIRYAGMCAGCDYRPLTTRGTVEPALLDVPGVSGVEIVGARVSDEAMARIAESTNLGAAEPRAVRLVRRIERDLAVPVEQA